MSRGQATTRASSTTVATTSSDKRGAKPPHVQSHTEKGMLMIVRVGTTTKRQMATDNLKVHLSNQTYGYTLHCKDEQGTLTLEWAKYTYLKIDFFMLWGSRSLSRGQSVHGALGATRFQLVRETYHTSSAISLYGHAYLRPGAAVTPIQG